MIKFLCFASALYPILAWADSNYTPPPPPPPPAFQNTATMQQRAMALCVQYSQTCHTNPDGTVAMEPSK